MAAAMAVAAGHSAEWRNLEHRRDMATSAIRRYTDLQDPLSKPVMESNNPDFFSTGHAPHVPDSPAHQHLLRGAAFSSSARTLISRVN